MTLPILGRRDILAGFAALGAGALMPALSSAAARPRRIDVHHHFYSPAWKAADLAWTQRKGQPPPPTAGWTVEKTLDDMDKGGVGTAILSMSSLHESWWGGGPELATSVARASNDFGAGIVRDHKGRFGLFALLPMIAVDASLKEIERALDELKADGVGIASSYGDKWPGDPMFRPIFEELNRRKAVVFIHPTFPDCCETILGIGPSPLEVPFDTVRAVTSLLLAGSFARFRDIKWIFTHAGGALPSLFERVNAFFAIMHPLKNLHDIAPDGIAAEIARLHFDVANAAWPAVMAGALKMAPVSQFMFGSDYPYFTAAMTGDALRKLPLSAAAFAAIDHVNAERLLPRLRRA
jgi:6-methylsalicylate decarboxylase